MGRWSTSPTHSTVHEGQISAGVGLKWCKWLNPQQKLQLTRTLCFTIPEASFSIPNRCLARLTVRINRATDAPECSPPGVVTLEHGAQSRTCFWWAEPHLGHRTTSCTAFQARPQCHVVCCSIAVPNPVKTSRRARLEERGVVCAGPGPWQLWIHSRVRHPPVFLLF